MIRCAHLKGTSRGGANGRTRLTNAKFTNDNATDILFGTGDLDWFWGSLAEIKDLESGEIVN